MKCVILQPSYIPWRGYFHQIQKADIFVFYDCVQYDDHGWRNRNQIKTGQGLQWLTIPVKSKGVHAGGVPIKDVPIVWTTAWNAKHFRSLQQSYGKAPFFDHYAPLLERFYARRDVLLADFTCSLTEAIAHELGLARTRFVRSSELPTEGRRTERLLSILRHLGASYYISGPSAKDYLEEDKLAQAGIQLEYMAYNYPPYPQAYGAFEPNVSILDLLFNVGPEAGKYIWGDS